MSTRARTQGFTLIELLVVMAIISVMLGLMLPAVQRVRDAASRSVCQNNLKQMGLACQNFHDDWGFLPPSRIADHWATWAVLILPYIEQNNLYSKWDLSRQYYEQSSEALMTRVKIYYCPARGKQNRFSTSCDWPDNGYPNSDHCPGACSDYAACCGDGTYLNISWADGLLANGAIVVGYYTVQDGVTLKDWRGKLTLLSITDGTSNTLLIGDKHVPVKNYGIGSSIGGDGSIYNGDHEWGFARVAGPGWPLAQNQADTTASYAQSFGSNHPGCCQFVMCDGSVRALANSTDTITLSRLSCRNDGMTIPNP